MSANASLLASYAGPSGFGGGERPVECGPFGDLLSNPAGKYYELARRGALFHAATATGGVSIASLTLTTTAPFALYNPKGSNADLVLLEVAMSYLSGTFGAGNLFYAGSLDPNQAAITGTAITAVPGRLGRSTGQGAPLTTATVPASPVILRNFCSTGAALATTADRPYVIVDDVAGSIIVTPGCAVSIQGVTLAGTSPLVHFSALWAEVPAGR